MALRKKSDSGSKRVLKEKVVQIYERFFQVRIYKYVLRCRLIYIYIHVSLFQGEDVLKDNPNFWEELFLLKPNVSEYFEKYVNFLYAISFMLTKYV